jgi:hypothetical protein
VSSSTIVVQKKRCIVNVDDLDYGVRDVAFEGKVLNQYGTYNRIAKKLIDDPSYTHLYCELLDVARLTTITLRVKSPHMKGNLWLLTMKVNLIKTSLLLEVHSKLNMTN